MLKSSKLVFWDFDGVIKDSVGVKGRIFKDLFLPYGEKLANRVYEHHLMHGGISRQEKIPLYLSWTNMPITTELVEKISIKFSKKAIESVVESPWNTDVIDYIHENYKRQQFILLTATPDEEIKEILKILNIAQFFKEIYGSSDSKSNIIRVVLSKLAVDIKEVVFVGDSESDYFAAQENSINFFLIPGEHNKKLQEMIGAGKNCYE